MNSRETMKIVLVPLSPARLRLLAVFALLTAMGSLAQTSPAVQAGVQLSPQMERRIEVMIRNRSGISADYAVQIGVPTATEIPGYDQVMVSFIADPADGSKAKTLPFYVSTDGKTLAQFNKFDMPGDLRNSISDTGRPARGGDEHAPVLIVVFDDLECPYCARMNAQLFPAVLNRYKDQVRIVYRDFPLPESQHPWAVHAAVDANCLATASPTGYWNYVDYIHAHAATMGADAKNLADSEKQLDKIAMDEGVKQGVNQPELVACVLKQDTTKIQASVAEGEAEPLRIGATPTIYINGERIDGIAPMETIYKIIDRALIAEGRTPPPPVAPLQTSPATPVQAQPGAPQTKPGS